MTLLTNSRYTVGYPFCHRNLWVSKLNGGAGKFHHCTAAPETTASSHSSARNYCIIAQQRQKPLHHRMHKGAAPIVSEQFRPELASASKWQASTAKLSLSWNTFEPFLTRGPWRHTLSASRPALRSVDVPSHVSQHTTFALHPQPHLWREEGRDVSD